MFGEEESEGKCRKVTSEAMWSRVCSVRVSCPFKESREGKRHSLRIKQETLRIWHLWNAKKEFKLFFVEQKIESNT